MEKYRWILDIIQKYQTLIGRLAIAIAIIIAASMIANAIEAGGNSVSSGLHDIADPINEWYVQNYVTN